MNLANGNLTLSSLIFYASAAHRCSYLPDRLSVSMFADPSVQLSMPIYNQLIRYGFRRSGEHIYTPQCPACNACVPIRITASEFQPSRSQRRIIKRNQDLSVRALNAEYNEEHFQLYKHYLHSRHRGGEMDNPTPQQYLNFLGSSWCDTVFFEFRQGTELMGVLVADHLDSGYSAVYSFYNPDTPKRSLGAFAILWLISECQKTDSTWVYLGYWIKQCDKMSYKDKFRPAEILNAAKWQKLPQLTPHAVDK